MNTSYFILFVLILSLWSQKLPAQDQDFDDPMDVSFIAQKKITLESDEGRSSTSNPYRQCYDLNRDKHFETCFQFEGDHFLSTMTQDRNKDGQVDWIRSLGSRDVAKDITRIIDFKDKSKFEVYRIEDQIQWTKNKANLELLDNQKFLVIEKHLDHKIQEVNVVALKIQTLDKSNTKPKIKINGSTPPCAVKKNSTPRLKTEVQEIEVFLKNIEEEKVASSKDKNGFYTTDYGLKIHESCLQKRPQIFKEVSAAYSEGFQCLKKLNTPKSLEHLVKMKAIFSDPKKSPKMICNQSNKDYDWSGTNAHATSDSLDKNYPQVSINPNTMTSFNPYDFKGTVFHESLHLLGYRHEEHAEYAYACEACCISKNKSSVYLKTACHVCGTNYNDILDTKYLEELYTLSQEEPRIEFSKINLMNAVLKNPKDSQLATLALKANGDPFSASLGKTISDFYKRQKVKPNEKYDKDIQIFANTEYNKVLQNRAEIIFKSQELIRAKKYEEASQILLNDKEVGDKSVLPANQKSFGYARDELNEIKKELLQKIYFNMPLDTPSQREWSEKVKSKYKSL